MPRLERIDHVQLSGPVGSEDLMRGFFAGLLGMTEEPKPPALARRGGCWFRSGAVAVHIGVEADFRPARKAHPAFGVSDLDEVAARLSDAGCEVRWDDSIPQVRRFHTDDPVGNRLEFLEV
ncbi:MAG: glyoxalase [Actinomycetales bacterium]|nr:MAG: glyoxalase [Actinomycetales bacterium]